MKNILLISESYSGGVKTYIDTIMLNHSVESDLHIHVLVSSRRLEKEEYIYEEYLVEDNLSFGKSPLKLFKSLKSLHRIVKQKNIGVIHANSTYAGIIIFLYALWNRHMYYIYTPHGYYSFKKMGKTKKVIIKFIEKQINKASNLIIHVSPSEELEAITNGLTESAKSTVVINGANDPNVDSDRNIDGDFTIVNLARVEDPKNPFEFIDIARKVVEQNPNVRFIWAGNGKYLEEARERVKNYGLEKQVDFMGYTNTKELLLQDSHLYLSTSEYEGMPFGVIEAMSYRLPLLLTDIIGHRDIVEGNENGLLFKSKEDHSVYEFVQSLIHDREKWHYLSSQSYRIFNERFNTTQMLRRLFKIYRSV